MCIDTIYSTVAMGYAMMQNQDWLSLQHKGEEVIEEYAVAHRISEVKRWKLNSR